MLKKSFRTAIILLTGLITLLLISAFFSQSVFINLKGTDKTASDSAMKRAFEYIGEKGPNWKSLVVSYSAETDIQRDTLWKYWTILDRWSKWQGMLVNSSKWLKDSSWKPGAEFEQTLNLGFPIGDKTSKEIVGDVKTKEFVAWWKNEGGIKSYHIWTFELLPNGKSRITNTEVFHGPLIGLTKIFYGRNWSDKFRQSVEGLVGYIEHSYTR